MVNDLEDSASDNIRESIKNTIDLAQLHTVLKNLLRDRIRLNDFGAILSAISNAGSHSKDPDLIAEYARRSLSAEICESLADEKGTLNALALEWEIEDYIEQRTCRTEKSHFLAIEPLARHHILMAIGSKIGRFLERGLEPVILCAPEVTCQVRSIAGPCFPGLKVLSSAEISPGVHVEYVGFVSLPMPGSAA